MDPQSDDALDQETLDQMISGSQPEGDDVDQLESMLADLDESADDEPAEGGESASPAKEADIDTLANNLEAILDRIESDEEQTGDDDAEVGDLNNLLYQATLADAEQAKAGGVTEDSDEEQNTGEESETPEDDLDALLEGLDANVAEDAVETEPEVDTVAEKAPKSEPTAEVEAEESDDLPSWKTSMLTLWKTL